MVDVVIKKSEVLSGEVCAPPSKSYTQRMLIAAALSNGAGKISNPLLSDDTEATLRAVTALGAETNFEENCWVTKGATPIQYAKTPIDCGESGATLRFMIPVAALAADPSILFFNGSLERRPIEPLIKSLDDLGARITRKKIGNKEAIAVEGGGILGGETSIRGDISSQFISGLMLACPMAKVDTEIIITTELESVDYAKMTVEVLSQHGVRVDVYGNFERIVIPANQMYKPVDSRVPGDFSSASFLLAAAAVTQSKVQVNDLDHESVQGDRMILGILKQMGVTGKVCDNSVQIDGSGKQLEALSFDARNILDLVPVCVSLACHANSTSKISGVARLKFKESDRQKAIYKELSKMGARLEVDSDKITVNGPFAMHGTSVDSHKDHRIAMALAVAALFSKGQTTIRNAECVRKSYPQFFNHLKHLGAEIVGGKFDR